MTAVEVGDVFRSFFSFLQEKVVSCRVVFSFYLYFCLSRKEGKKCRNGKFHSKAIIYRIRKVFIRARNLYYTFSHIYTHEVYTPYLVAYWCNCNRNSMIYVNALVFTGVEISCFALCTNLFVCARIRYVRVLRGSMN